MLHRSLRRAAPLVVGAQLLAAAVAQADCQSDFARDNRVKPEAGPFKTVEERIPMSKLDDERWVMTLRQGKVTSVTEIVPARNAFRFTTDAPLGDNMVVLGQRGWQQSGADGQWKALDALTMRELAGALDNYLTAADMSELSCSAQAQDGRSLRTYRYNVPGDGLSSRTTSITAQFDAQSGLPVAATFEGAAAKNKVSGTTRFVFDRGIDVKPPKGAGKP